MILTRDRDLIVVSLFFADFRTQVTKEKYNSYILRCVTSGISYDKMVASGIPCSRDYFYDRYRKFFWILDRIRDFIPTYSGK